MTGAQVNRVSGRGLIALSLIALLTVLSGYFQAPPTDEGIAAHMFQIAIAAWGLVFVVFLATADWQERWRAARPLALPATALVLAFGALFYLEHYYYVAH